MQTPLGDHPPVILIAEDDPAIRDVLCLLLEDAGYRVVTATDGVDALEVARTSVPDVMLVDAGMPRLDGAGFCRAYREGGGTAPVALVSAAGHEVVTATVEACGAAAYIPKPFDVEDVLRTVAGLAGRA